MSKFYWTLPIVCLLRSCLFIVNRNEIQIGIRDYVFLKYSGGRIVYIGLVVGRFDYQVRTAAIVTV